MGWVFNRIPYCLSDGCIWLGIGYCAGSWLEELKKARSTIDSCTYMYNILYDCLKESNHNALGINLRYRPK